MTTFPTATACGRGRDERGAALVVAIIMVFMLSLLGVSAMQGSTVERRMADNAVQTSTSFQVAESGGELLLNDSSNLGRAFGLNGEPLAIDVEAGLSLEPGIDATAAIRYVGDGAAPGFSLGQGSSNFMALRYRVDSEGSIDSVRSFSSVTQGAHRVVPAP